LLYIYVCVSVCVSIHSCTKLGRNTEGSERHSADAKGDHESQHTVSQKRQVWHVRKQHRRNVERNMEVKSVA